MSEREVRGPILLDIGIYTESHGPWVPASHYHELAAAARNLMTACYMVGDSKTSKVIARGVVGPYVDQLKNLIAQFS